MKNILNHIKSFKYTTNKKYTIIDRLKLILISFSNNVSPIKSAYLNIS